MIAELQFEQVQNWRIMPKFGTRSLSKAMKLYWFNGAEPRQPKA